MVRRVGLRFISYELMKGWMAEVSTARRSHPEAFNAENPRTNVNFLSKRAKSERLCVGFEMQSAGRSRPLATHRRCARYASTQSRVRAKSCNRFHHALCHMHEALVHVQTQKQALLREEHRIGMERSRGISRAPLLIARIFDRQPTIPRRGNATAQQEEHAR